MAPRNQYPPQAYASPTKSYVQYQPQAAPVMTPRVNPLNAEGKPRDQQGQRDWNSGLCGCCASPGDFLLACFCPCIIYGNTKQRLNDLNAGHGGSSPSCCSGGSWIYCLLCSLTGLGCCLDWGLRTDIRSRYHIDGGGFGDCLVASFCPFCNQVQSAREVQQELDVLRQQAPSNRY